MTYTITRGIAQSFFLHSQRAYSKLGANHLTWPTPRGSEVHHYEFITGSLQCLFESVLFENKKKKKQVLQWHSLQRICPSQNISQCPIWALVGILLCSTALAHSVTFLPRAAYARAGLSNRFCPSVVVVVVCHKKIAANGRFRGCNDF